MKAILYFSVVSLLGVAVFAQSPDIRSYDQIAGSANKTVVDYFLLCPAIILKTYTPGQPAELAIARDEDRLDTKGADLAFRKSLLVTGGQAPNLVVSSVMVDQKNAYIRIEGNHQGRWTFDMVFVYFERADKSRIPALTYHYTGMEDIEDYHLFFDIRDGLWKTIPDDQILPPISEKALFPYVGSGDASTTTWILDDLPRYGTTIRFSPRRQSLEGEGDPKLAAADSFLERLLPYAFDCAWDKTQAKFTAPKPVLADQTDIPKGKATAADIFVLLSPPGQGSSSGTQSRRKARDAWKASAHDTKNGATDYFQWTMNPDEGNEGVRLKILGRYKGLPLIAEVDWQEEIYTFATLLYHADSGLLEHVDLIKLSIKDFYKGSRASEAEGMWPGTDMPYQYSIGESDDAILVSLDAWHDQSVGEFPPDVTLSFRWNDQSASFEKSEQKFEM